MDKNSSLSTSQSLSICSLIQPIEDKIDSEYFNNILNNKDKFLFVKEDIKSNLGTQLLSMSIDNLDTYHNYKTNFHIYKYEIK